MTERTIVFTATSASVPGWFTAQTAGTWVEKASGSDQTLSYALNNPAQASSGPTSPDVTNASTGSVVNQELGEYMLAANGGHANYYGNEVYACKIRSETPYWYRLLDCTPSAYTAVARDNLVSASNTVADQHENPNMWRACFSDGRMRSQHGWHSNIFHNGKVWYIYQGSPSGNGFTSHHAWSFDRHYPGLPLSPSRSPLAWSNDAGPWEWLGRTQDGSKLDASQASNLFGIKPSAALDRVTGKVWMAHEDAPRNRWVSLDTNTGTLQVSSAYSTANSETNWAVVVTDPTGQDRWRMYVTGDVQGSRLNILNLKAANPYISAAWSYGTLASADGTAIGSVTAEGLGAVYHRASKAILLYDAITGTDGRPFVVRVPTNADGTYNASGSWLVSKMTIGGSVNPHGTLPFPGSTGLKSFSKFNLIEDMGNGQSACVVVTGMLLPTYVLKLPLAGV